MLGNALWRNEQNRQNKQQYIDAVYGLTPINRADSAQSVPKDKHATQNQQGQQMRANNFEQPFFTTEAVPEKAGKLKQGSISSFDTTSSSSSFDDTSSSNSSSFDHSSRSEDYFTLSHPSFSSSSSSSSSAADSFSSDYSSSSSELYRRPLRRPSLAPRVNRITYQRPWCAGQALASLIPIAREPVYQWLISDKTCVDFAKRFGNLYVQVINLETASPLCEYQPTSGAFPYSSYASTRSMAINQPIYASVSDEMRGVVFATASGIILEHDGIVLAINIAKPVTELPQIC